MEQTSFSAKLVGKNFNRSDSYFRHTRNHLQTSDEKSYDSETVDDSMICDSDFKENVCPNQSGGGKSSNDILVNDTEADEVKEDCNLEEEAIEGNLKKSFIEATDKGQYHDLFMETKCIF